MELKLVTDLIDALAKVAGGLKAIVNLAKAEREAMRRTLDETYRLVDTTLDIVIIRLGDIRLLAADDDLLREAARLDTYNAWIQAEREFRGQKGAQLNIDGAGPIRADERPVHASAWERGRLAHPSAATAPKPHESRPRRLRTTLPY